MNKKEIAEIKKNFSDDSGFFTVGKVLSAFIDAEKNIVYKDTVLYNLMNSEEAELIMEILRKTLSGTLGKNLKEYAFPKEQYDDGGSQKFMYDLLCSKLADDEVNEKFLKRIAENVEYISTFAVFSAHCTYSVLKKNKNDDLEDDDAELDYNFVITAICPVDLRFDGLIYSDENCKIEKKTTCDRIVGMPTDGFLYPVFSERAPDVNSVMYYSKNFKKPNTTVVENFLGCEFVMTAPSEKQTFQKILSNVVGEELDYELITNVNEKLTEYVDSYTHETEPAQVDAGKLNSILWECGVSQDKLEHVSKVFENATDNKPLTAANLIDRKTVVEVEGITVNIGKDSVDKVQTQEIGGRKCLVIALDDNVSVNGLPANV
ncbi:MAG: DUF4317 domain-containing protein [Ruminococcus sp.]|nr:DUF4317 domain-containing protein [Bacillota bacterium]MBP3270839.1 DUF4317 domain-containing protein [Ruminococcus sp.]